MKDNNNNTSHNNRSCPPKVRFSSTPTLFVLLAVLCLSQISMRLWAPSELPPPPSASESSLQSWSSSSSSSSSLPESSSSSATVTHDHRRAAWSKTNASSNVLLTTVVTTITTTTTTTSKEGVNSVTTTSTTVQKSNHTPSSSSSLRKQQQHREDTAVTTKNAAATTLAAAVATERTTTAVALLSKSQNQPDNNNNNNQPKQLKIRIPNLQDLSRRNASRALCGYIPKASPKGVRFPHILSTSKKEQQSSCRPNAIVYLTQKGTHSSYGRNSSALFMLSLDSLYNHYLSIDNKYDTVDVLIAHAGDFDETDLDELDRRYHRHVHFKLINLNDTDYWEMPESVQQDDRHRWQQAGRYTLGYRHMLRWYSLKLYDFARDYATIMPNGCNYSYLMRMDEDSFLHSPIQYNLFDFMKSNNYAYAFRLCSYEMDGRLWEDYEDHVQYCGDKLPAAIPYRRPHDGLCGFYNNFFIIDIQFILQPDVQHFLQWTDATGINYRERYNDLQIQTFAVYAFAPPERIHRFLDWTYEHMSDFKKCPRWGALQAGYLDRHVNVSMHRFLQKYKPCETNLPRDTYRAMYEVDLSPTYAHLPPSSWFQLEFGVPRNQFKWKTYAAAAAEQVGRGVNSG